MKTTKTTKTVWEFNIGDQFKKNVSGLGTWVYELVDTHRADDNRGGIRIKCKVISTTCNECKNEIDKVFWVSFKSDRHNNWAKFTVTN